MTLDLTSLIVDLGGDRDALDIVIAAFLDQVATVPQEIRSAIESGDSQAAAVGAHTLKGSVRVFGDTVCAASAERLEQITRARADGDALEALADLERRLGSLAAALREYTQGSPAARSPAGALLAVRDDTDDALRLRNQAS